MKINKILISSILFLVIGCKKETSKIVNHNIQIDSLEHDLKHDAKKNNEIDRFIKESIVISCGSGCAISYSPENIKQFNNTIKVTFNVKMYENEDVTDTYDETYIFSYNNSNKLDKIEKEKENGDFLKTLMPDAQQSFIKFGENLISNQGSNLLKENNNLPNENNYKICVLPFDFEDYYNTCYDHAEKCSEKYPSYTLPENKKILDY